MSSIATMTTTTETVTTTMTLRHAASDDDLLLRAAPNAQEASNDPTDQCAPHSDEELDVEDSAISVRSVIGGRCPNAPSSADESLPVEIAFSASGGAFVYQMGVAAYIQEHFDLSNCHISGCSGGSWAATLLAAGTDVRHAWSVIQATQRRLVPDNAKWYSGYGRYATIVAETIQDLWKDDSTVHKRVTERHLSIAVTRFPSMAAENHTSWESLDDLMKSILASALIPFALSGRPCITHRGKWYVDGGITNFKGIHCDQYSTLADIYYHGKVMTVETIRRTASCMFGYFLPAALSKPITRLVDRLLPHMDSPHDAIAPRRLAYDAANPQSAVEHDPATTRPRLLIKPWTWRSHPVTAFHLSVDIATHQARFDHGYEDARAHHHELAAVLPPIRR